MHANRYWLIFLSIVAAVALWKGGEGLYRLYGYYRLTAQAPAEVTQWSVEKLSEERYALRAHYKFRVGDQFFTGDYLFRDKPYLNPWAAEKSVPSEFYQAWYVRSNPHISSLQKKFPIKECVTAIVAVALLLYFIWLGYYVASVKQ